MASFFLLNEHILSQVATNLENLEYSGISLNMRKIVTNKVFLVRHSNICLKQLLIG